MPIEDFGAAKRSAKRSLNSEPQPSLSPELQRRYNKIIESFSQWSAAVKSTIRGEQKEVDDKTQKTWYQDLWKVKEKGKTIIKDLGAYDAQLEVALNSSQEFGGLQSAVKQLPHFNPFDQTDVGFTASLAPSKDRRKLELHIFYDHSYPNPGRGGGY